MQSSFEQNLMADEYTSRFYHQDRHYSKSRTGIIRLQQSQCQCFKTEVVELEWFKVTFSKLMWNRRNLPCEFVYHCTNQSPVTVVSHDINIILQLRYAAQLPHRLVTRYLRVAPVLENIKLTLVATCALQQQGHSIQNITFPEFLFIWHDFIFKAFYNYCR